jgi:hypothetical protein
MLANNRRWRDRDRREGGKKWEKKKESENGLKNLEASKGGGN